MDGLFVGISAKGIYNVDLRTGILLPVAATLNSAGYEYSYMCPCQNGEFFVHQRGFLGERFFRFDTLGVAHPLSFTAGDSAGTRVDFASLRNDGSLFITLARPDGSYKNRVSVDCASTWFDVPMDMRPVANSAVMLLATSSPTRFYMATPGLGNRAYPLPHFTRSQITPGLLGADSITWISRGRTANDADTLWMCNITDSTLYRIDSVVTVRGVEGTVNLQNVRLVSTTQGRLYMFASAGWYAEWQGGSWVLRDSVSGILNAANNSGARDVYSITQGSIGDSLFYARVDLRRDSNQVSRGAIIPGFPPGYMSNFRSIADSVLRYSLFVDTSPTPIVRSDGQTVWLNEVAGVLDELEFVPALMGFTDTTGSIVVVGPHDMAVAKSSGAPGLLRASALRGEVYSDAKVHGPRIQTSRGLRTPFVGSNEILMPGTTVKQLTRDGRFRATVHNGAATAVPRRSSGELIIADSSVIRSHNENGDTLLVDLAQLDCSAPGGTGFVSALTELSDGTLLAFVNGIAIQDSESLEKLSYRCGFIARSTNGGRTWVRSQQPLESPYFLGHILLADGSIVTSATRVVRDTTPRRSDDNAPVLETKSHICDDRQVMRSTDMGRSWTLVHSSAVSSAYRLLGGNGAIDTDGSLLLLTVDGLLRSTNDGGSWEVYDVPGIDPGTFVISMFQHQPRSRVYFCTTTGVYGSDISSSVANEQSSVVEPVLPPLAQSWHAHQQVWQRERVALNALITLTGSRIPAEQLTTPPATGTYVAQTSLGGNTTYRIIMVTP